MFAKRGELGSDGSDETVEVVCDRRSPMLINYAKRVMGLSMVLTCKTLSRTESCMLRDV
jgi:hypothetical protein